MSNPWTEEFVAELKRQWADGLSCSVIARNLGNGISRNAVIGKVVRLGLPPRLVPTRTLTLRPRKRKMAHQPCVPGSVPLVDLTPTACRFPMGDPQDESFGFCGCTQQEGSSYCPDHHAIAHTRKPDRRVAMLEAEPVRKAA
jgi:GcrA cell cycle regulator